MCFAPHHAQCESLSLHHCLIYHLIHCKPWNNTGLEVCLSVSIPSSLGDKRLGFVEFDCTALSPSVRSDVIMINANHAGFTVCLFYCTLGRADHLSTPAGSMVLDQGI